MNPNLPVSKLMSKELIVLNADDSIWDAEKTFRDYHLRHAPVIADGELTGMLSITDLRGMTDDKIGRALKVQDLMTSDPVALQTNAPIRELARLFVDHEFHAVPIMQGTAVVGIVSTTDLIRHLMEKAESEA